MNYTGFIENVVLREMLLKYKISKEVDKSQVGILLVHQVFRSSSGEPGWFQVFCRGRLAYLIGDSVIHWLITLLHPGLIRTSVHSLLQFCLLC